MNVTCNECERHDDCLKARRCIWPRSVEAALTEMRAAIQDMNAATTRLSAATSALAATQAIEKGMQP